MKSRTCGSVEDLPECSQASVPPVIPLMLQFMKKDSVRERVSKASEKASSSSSPSSLKLPCSLQIGVSAAGSTIGFVSVFPFVSSLELCEVFDNVPLPVEEEEVVVVAAVGLVVLVCMEVDEEIGEDLRTEVLLLADLKASVLTVSSFSSGGSLGILPGGGFGATAAGG